MTEVVYVSAGRIEIERRNDGSVNVTSAWHHYRPTVLPLSKVEAAEFLAAVAREFDVTFTANPKPLKVGDVVDRDTVFGLPHGSLVEVIPTGAPYYRVGRSTLIHRFGTKYTIGDFDTDEKFTIKYIGGNA